MTVTSIKAPANFGLGNTLDTQNWLPFLKAASSAINFHLFDGFVMRIYYEIIKTQPSLHLRVFYLVKCMQNYKHNKINML